MRLEVLLPRQDRRAVDHPTRSRRGDHWPDSRDAYQRQIVIAIFTSIAITALSLWIAYLIIRAAIRDAIKESGLVEALRRSRTTTSGKADDLPKMTID